MQRAYRSNDLTASGVVPQPNIRPGGRGHDQRRLPRLPQLPPSACGRRRPTDREGNKPAVKKE